MEAPAPTVAHDIAIIRSSERAVRDPVTGRPGYSSGTSLMGGAERVVIYYAGRHGQFFLVGDWYSMKGAPSYLNIFCPLCGSDPNSQRGSLRISQDNKAIDFDRDVPARIRGFDESQILASLQLSSIGGRISIEPFGCTWEVEPTLRRGFGFGVCTWRVAIDNNVARDV